MVKVEPVEGTWADITEQEALEELQREIARHVVSLRMELSDREWHAWFTYLKGTPAKHYLLMLLGK